MPKQLAIPRLRDAMKKKVTRREQFLAEMDAVVPWPSTGADRAAWPAAGFVDTGLGSHSSLLESHRAGAGRSRPPSLRPPAPSARR